MITSFTPYASLFGGAMIGLAAVLLMLMLGRIMGATAILTGLMIPQSGQDWAWRAAILLGMLSGPVAFLTLTGEFPAIDVPVSVPVMMGGGFLVGIGVTYGSGCTSGHGVCGIARLSPRSIAATATFMLTTSLTVYVMRHVIGA